MKACETLLPELKRMLEFGLQTDVMTGPMT